MLTQAFPEHGLSQGETGTAVYVHPDGGCEAEFVAPSGRTIAVISLLPTDFKRIEHTEFAVSREPNVLNPS